MADGPISGLSALTGATIDLDNDLLYIADVSAGASGSKKITPREALTDIYALLRANTSTVKPGGVIFDGTGSKYIYGATQTIGTSDFSVRLRFRLPASTPATSPFAFGLGGASTCIQQYGFVVYPDTTGGITMRTYGVTTGTDYAGYQIAGAGTTYAGKVIDLVITRSGTTVVAYINGVAQTLTTANGGGSVPAWSQSIGGGYVYLGNYVNSSAGQPYTSGIYWPQIFNFALTSAEVSELLMTGVSQKWRWGSFTAKYASDFSAGVDSWNQVRCTLTGNVDSIFGRDDCLRLVTDSTASNSHYAYYLNVGSLSGPRRISVSFDYYIPSGNAVAKAVRMIENTGSSVIASGTTLDAWATASGYLEAPVGWDGRVNLQMAVSAVNATFTGNGTDLIYVRNIVVKADGCVQDIDLTTGAGYWFPDRSSNNLWVEGTPTGWQHKIAAKSGQYMIVKTLQHSDISSTAETTLLFNLPGNHAVMDIQFDREAAFTAGVTLRVGPTGANTKYVNDQAADATGIVNVSPYTGNGAAEATSSYNPIWIKKSGATTTGTTTVRVRIAIKG